MKIKTVTDSLVNRLSRSGPVYRDSQSLSRSVSVSTTADAVSRNHQLCQVAVTLCPFLYTNEEDPTAAASKKDLLMDNILNVTPLMGGLSNYLFVVENNHTHAKVLVRIHPDEDGDAGIIDRATENRLMAWLSRQGQAPTLYGRFENGRVEEFYDQYIPLNCHEMVQYGPDIARLLGGLHSLPVPADILEPTPRGYIWKTVDHWLELLTSPRDDNDESSTEDVLVEKQSKPRKTTATTVRLDELKQEWNWLKNALQQQTPDQNNDLGVIDFCQQVVLSHMDLQSLNVLRPANGDVPGDGNLKLIDFEYAGLNPRAVDIANFFCEHCDMNNLRADYEKEYPSEATQDAFLRVYLDSLDASPLERLDEKQREAFLVLFRQEIGRWTIVSHLSWAIWSLVQDRLSSIDFDYVAYAQQRMTGYYLFKKKYWKSIAA